MSELLDRPVNGERVSEHSGGEMHLEFPQAIARSLPWVCLLIAVGAAAGILAGLLQADTFVSSAKLLLRLGVREQMTADSLLGPDGAQRASPPSLSDEVDMLSDAGVYERVARKVGPRVILQPPDPASEDRPDTPFVARQMHCLQSSYFRWKADEHDGATEDAAEQVLRKNTVIVNEPGSNVIRVSHTASSPEKARAITMALTDAFIERHREQFSIQSLVQKSRDNLERARKARDESADAFIQHMNRVDVVDVDTQAPALQTEINALERELFTARMRRAEIKRQQAALSERLTGVPAEIETVHPPTMVPNDEYETQLALKRSLLAQKQSVPFEIRPKEEIRQRERDLDAAMAAVDQKLKQIPREVRETTERRENQGRATLTTRVDDLDVEDAALGVKVDLVSKRLTDKQAQLAESRRQGLVAALRRQDLTAARDAADARFKRVVEQASMLETLGNGELDADTNLRVIQSPTLDPEPTAPHRLSLFLKGLLGGLLAGCVFAILRPRFDRTLRYPEEFERSHGVPVLAVVPRWPSLHRLSRNAVTTGS